MRALLLTLVVFAASAAAGQTAPTIGVTDENGIAVSGARVSLESPTGTTGQCQTDFTGRCRFAALAAGTYRLRVEKEGFYAVVQPSVQIAAASTLEVTITHQQEVKEVVNVVESPPAIDPAQVSAQETISGLDVLDIVYPATNDYRNVLNFIPGVVQDQNGQPHVAGAQTYQTVTLLDGFNVTQPANGELLVRVSTDAFRSIRVEPAREPAEEGKGSGGVLSLNTGIGDDHFRFAATDFIPSVQDKHGWRFDQFLPRLTFSGPVEKGKVWFYNALDGEYDNIVNTGLPIGQDNDHLFRVGNLSKVQTNLTSRNILTTSFLVNDLRDQYAYLSQQNPQLTNPKDVESAYVASVKDQHYFAGEQLLETGFAFDQYNLRLTPYGMTPYAVNPNMASGSFYLNEETHARRWQALANLYIPPQQWHGRHDLKVGVDLDRISYEAQFERNPISYWAGLGFLGLLLGPCPTEANGTPVVPSPCLRYSTFSGGQLSSTFNTEISAYAEDRWLPTNHLLIAAGARLDWDEVVRHAEVAPRVAGTYVLDNAGNTKLSAGIGLVYDATPIFLVARPFAGERTDYFFNPTGQLTSTVLTTFSVDRSALQMPRFLNWSLGLEKKLPEKIYLKAEVLEKRGSRGLVYDALNELLNPGDFILQNTRDDRYDALQLTLRHNFRENFTVMGAYTRSRARSNQALDFNVDSPILSGQQPGPYPWDTPNRFLSWGYLPFFKLPLLHQTEITYSMEARTGFPFSLLNDQQQLISSVGAERFPRYVSLNLQLEKRFHAFGYYWALRGGFDNITGRCNPYVVNNVIDAQRPAATFSACEGRAFTSRIRLLGRK
jgi:hypothetical protein